VCYDLAACKTSYAPGLKQMQLATHYSLHNHSVSISGLFLDLTQACATQKAWKTKLTNTDLPRAAKSISFWCSLKVILERQSIYTRSRAVATFFAIAKALAGRMSCRPAKVWRQCSCLQHQTWNVKVLVSIWRNAWLLHLHHT